MITAEIIQKVFFLRYKDIVGTAFTNYYNGVEYLITARHLFQDVSTSGERIEISIHHEKAWKILQVTIHIHSNPEVDVAVLKAQINLGHPTPIIADDKGIIYSQDAFFIGFPYGNYYEAGLLNNNFPMPFIKKGIISAWEMFCSYYTGKIFIDGHNNPGFSGGPVVFQNFNLPQRPWCFCGVVSGYIPQTNSLDILGQTQFYHENSGIVVVHNIGFASAIILTIRA